MSPEFELRLYRHLHELSDRLRDARDAAGAVRYGLRTAREFLGADEACLALLPAGGDRAILEFAVPQGDGWPMEVLTGFLRGENVVIPRDLVLARIRRRARPWGVIALRRRGHEFDKDSVLCLTRVAEAVSQAVERIDAERIHEVRARIDRKVMEQLPPKDLFYQILHGLRSLTVYDHSSALFIFELEGARLRLVAEQIAWTKAKSRSIGLQIPLAQEIARLLEEDTVLGFDRAGQGWRAWSGGERACVLAGLLDYDGAEGEAPGAMLVAPLAAREGPLGLLKVAARRPGTFGEYESGLLRGFMSIASVALRNSQRTEVLQAHVLDAIRKHAIVDLARGVSHDVNNALGAVIPLVQQMQEDLREGGPDRPRLETDLGEIERSLQICRRIFGGMLSFARTSARATGEADVRRALEGTKSVLGDSIERRGVRLELDVPRALPPVQGRQGDLEQLFLNLVTNARDATPEGGRITVSARQDEYDLEVVVEDTGCGIPPEHLPKIQEPFFTTKANGTGLGLSTVRWIVWEMRGRLSFESEPGRGARVTVRLPASSSASTAPRADEAEAGSAMTRTDSPHEPPRRGPRGERVDTGPDASRNPGGGPPLRPGGSGAFRTGGEDAP